MKLALAFFAAVLFGGCALIPGNVATLWTDHAEFATYAELFNASQNRYRVQIEYKTIPAESVSSNTREPDIIVGERIAGVATIGQFSPLDQILGQGQISRNQFYRTLLATGRRDGRQFLLPVSFQLPMILYQQATPAPDDKSTMIDLGAMKTQSLDFQKNADGSFVSEGFSPLWNANFLLAAVMLSGADFHQTSRGNLAWDETKLQAGIATLRDWIAGVDGGPDNEATFRDKYLYDPIDKLLASNRILFYYMTSTNFYDLPAEKRRAIHFKWFDEGGRIPVPENVLYVGVPNRSRNKGAAYAFLEWFFNPENQSKILQASSFQKMKTFGVANGFSSIRIVNERDFPQYYPSLLGRVPSAETMEFSRSLPTDWEDLKLNVLVPWLEHEVAAAAPDQKLDDRLRAWRLQKPLQ